MYDLSWAQSHPPSNCCVRFATTVASGHATLATKRTLLLTWAGLPPAGSHQLCLAHSFDHLVREQLHRIGNGNSQRCCGSEIDHQLELGWLLDWQVAGNCAAHDLVDIGRRPPPQV